MKFEIKKDTAVVKHNRAWQFCVGAGHAPIVLRKDYTEQIKFVCDELKIRRIRFHGIFCDDMHTCDNLSDMFNISGDDCFTDRFAERNFRLIGTVYDNVISAGMQPFVELSFMPKNLAADPGKRGSMFPYNPIICPPKDDAVWKEYIRQFIHFLFHRYGKEEVEQWYFEVWNEPDLTMGYFSGTQEEYFHLYEITACAIKEVDARIMVGGPSTSASKWTGAFLRYCREHNVPVDFISTHQYSGDPIGGVLVEHGVDVNDVHIPGPENMKAALENMSDELKALPENSSILPAYRIFMPDDTESSALPVYRSYMPDDTGNSEDIGTTLFPKNAAIVKSQSEELPVFYTEWNVSASYCAEGNDTRKVAAYDLVCAVKTDNIIDGSSIWCLSDIMEELPPIQEEFHGGYGLVTQHGIPKPVFYMLKMLSLAGDERFDMPEALEGEVAMMAFRGAGKLQVFLTRVKVRHFANLGLLAKEATVQIELEKAPASVTLCRIDEEHCNSYKIWKDMGSPIDMNADEIRSVIEKSAPVEEEVPFSYADGILTIEAKIKTNDVYRFEITQ